jgi:hypothetical protein
MRLKPIQILALSAALAAAVTTSVAFAAPSAMAAGTATTATGTAATGAAGAAAAAAATTATRAARQTPTVWVDAKVSRRWHVGSAVAFVDRYTGTKLRLGKCHTGAECIRIREKWNMDGGVAGLTYVGGSPTTTIHLNARNRDWMTWGQRYNTVIHELGHARGVYAHDRRCNSVMYSSTNCNKGTGRLTPRTFTAAEKKILRNH